MSHNPPQRFHTEQNVLDNIKVFFPHVQITLQELRNPTSEAVSKIYGSFLEELGVNIGNLLQIQNNQMTLIAHVDLYNVSVPMLNQYHGINFFLKKIGVDDFGVSDLVMPSSKRTLKFFNALLQFLSYCDDRIANLTPELERLRDLRSFRTEVLSKIEILRNEINHRASARSQRQDKIKELDKLIVMESDKLDSIMKEKQQQIAAMNSIKKLLEEDTKRENELIQTIKQIDEDVTELKGRIVKSPEKLKNLVVEQTEKKEELLLNIKNLKSQIEEKKRLTQTISEQLVKQEERYQKARDLLEIQISIRDKEQEKIELCHQYDKLQERCDENEFRIGEKQERKKVIQVNVDEHRRRKEKQEIEEKELLEVAEKELQALMNRCAEKIKSSDEIQMLVNQICEELQQMEGKFLTFKEHEVEAQKDLQSKEKYLVWKYETIMLKLRQINENLAKRFQ